MKFSTTLISILAAAAFVPSSMAADASNALRGSAPSRDLAQIPTPSASELAPGVKAKLDSILTEAMKNSMDPMQVDLNIDQAFDASGLGCDLKTRIQLSVTEIRGLSGLSLSQVATEDGAVGFIDDTENPGAPKLFVDGVYSVQGSFPNGLTAVFTGSVKSDGCGINIPLNGLSPLTISPTIMVKAEVSGQAEVFVTKANGPQIENVSIKHMKVMKVEFDLADVPAIFAVGGKEIADYLAPLLKEFLVVEAEPQVAAISV